MGVNNSVINNNANTPSNNNISHAKMKKKCIVIGCRVHPG